MSNKNKQLKDLESLFRKDRIKYAPKTKTKVIPDKRKKLKDNKSYKVSSNDE